MDDILTTDDVAAAGEAGVSLRNIVLHRDADGRLLSGRFTRASDGLWSYSGGLCDRDSVIHVNGLRMSPWAGRALDAVREHMARGTG